MKNVKINRTLAAAMLFLTMTTPLSRIWAQGWSKVETGIGYSYTSVDPNIGLGQGNRLSANGTNAYGSIGLQPWLAAEFNFANAIHSESDTISNPSITPVSTNVSEKHFTYTFGPRFVLDKGNFRPFAHALIGIDHKELQVSASTVGASVFQNLNDNALAALLGGGVAIPVSRHVALTASGDYLLTRHGSPAIVSTILGLPHTSATQNNFRASVGISFRFGTGYGQDK